jgi:hypothetical protein
VPTITRLIFEKPTPDTIKPEGLAQLHSLVLATTSDQHNVM